MKYTVILLRPDYIAGTFGQDTFMAHVAANTPTKAVARARDEVAKVDQAESKDAEDYFVITVIEGHHPDLNPE